MYESQLNNMLQMLAKHEITPADFTAFKNDIPPKLNALKSKNIDIDDVEDELRKYLKKGLMLIKNISQVYDYTPLEGKQKIIRSIFKKNIVFQENGVRTEKINEVFLLIASVDKGFKGIKKKTEDINSLQSYQVPYGLDLSNFMNDFQAIRILMNALPRIP